MAANLHIEEFTLSLLPDLVINWPRLVGSCPIHQGDNEQAFNINIDPDSDYCGRWFCNTKHCHLDHKNDIIGLVEAVKGISFMEALAYIDEKYDSSEMEEVTNTRITRYLAKRSGHTEDRSYALTRDQVRAKLSIPSNYYLNRGFSEEALNHFDVGLCLSSGTDMSGRVVFPVYDAKEEYMVGCVGRYPVDDAYMRWKNSKGFNKANHLFAFGKARQKASELGIMILCEGQGDVIRLWEAGIENAVGLFGCELHHKQMMLLTSIGIQHLVLMLDKDEAGNDAYEKIVEMYGGLFTIHNTDLPTKDIGDMTVDEINSVIKPQIKGMY